MPELAKEDPTQYFQFILSSAAQLSGVRIDRERYLAGALGRKFSPEVIETAIVSSPARAGIRVEQLDQIADASIRFETMKVTALSAATGIPGGLAMAGTVPADLVQYFAHILRIGQKLAYLYGWENMFDGPEEEVSDETKNLLILFMGIMFGVSGTTDAVSKLAKSAAKVAAKRIPQKALTKGVVYPVVKRLLDIWA